MARAINEVKKNRSTAFESKIWNEFKKSRCEMKKNRNRKKVRHHHHHHHHHRQQQISTHKKIKLRQWDPVSRQV